MSPRLERILRAIDRETRALAAQPHYDADGWVLPDTAVYPRDYYRPYDLLRRWRGPGRFFHA